MDSEFVNESLELIDELEVLLKKIEDHKTDLNSDTVYLRSISRIIHNLKGSSSFFDLEDFTRNLHLFEDFLLSVEFSSLSNVDRDIFISYFYAFTDYCRSLLVGDKELRFKVVSSLSDLKLEGSDYVDIVLVEDDVDQTSLYSLILDDLTYSYKVFNSPRSALEFIKKTPPRLVVSDYKMPQLNGLDLFQELRSMGVKSVFIFVTGIDDKDIFQRLNEVGAISVLSKPISMAHFIFHINRAMRYAREKDVSLRSVKCLMSHFEALKSFYESNNKSFMVDTLKKEINLILKDYGESIVD